MVKQIKIYGYDYADNLLYHISHSLMTYDGIEEIRNVLLRNPAGDNYFRYSVLIRHYMNAGR